MKKIVIDVDDRVFYRLASMYLIDHEIKYILGELLIFIDHVQGISFVKD